MIVLRSNPSPTPERGVGHPAWDLTSGNWYTANVVVDDDCSAGSTRSRSAARGRSRGKKR